MTDRVHCEHAHECAGCPLIDQTYASQLEAKREHVARSAALYPTLAPLAIDPTAPAEPIVRYRVRAKWMVGAPPAGNGAPIVGLFARPGAGPDHRVVDIPGCRVLTPSLHDVASRLRELLADPPAAAGRCLVPEAREGLLSAVDLREVVDEQAGVLVTLVLATRPAASETELENAAHAVRGLSPAVVGVAVNYREPRAVQVLGATTRTIVGPSLVRDRLGAIYRLATYGSFTQAHRGQAARIEEWIAASVDPSERVLDLYGGSGALSLPLARRGSRVTLIESFGPAAECAERAAKEQNLDGFSVRSGDAAIALSDLVRSREHFDVAIANPPRRGMSPAVRSAIAALAPRLVAYVSCDPESLCRDLDHLARLGYRADRLRPIDMIPLTDQVETVVLLRPATPPPPRLAFDDDEIFVMDRCAYDPPPLQGSPLREARVLRDVAPGASGLAVGCKAATVETALRAKLADARASRTELVLCRGVTAREGVAGRRTQYRRIARAAGHSLLRVRVRGDREARIESDLARIGHPVVGDTRHGHAPTNRHFEERYALDRPFSHRMKVEFDHPRTGTRIVAEGELPGELAMVLGRLGLVALDVAKEVMVG